MKQINKILIVFVMSMVVLTAIAVAALNGCLTKEDKSYEVAINRIEAGETISDPIRRISYLKRDATVKERQEFFDGTGVASGCNYTVRLSKGEAEEYVRYEYVIEKQSVAKPIIMLVSIMGAVTCLAAGLMIYIKYTVLKPFHKIEQMPYELAKGNYTEDMKESKYRYFGKFLWGLDRLKEELSKNKERQLALEKEKKLMILTVSHDIKTPLSSIYLYTKALSEHLYKEEEKKQEIYKQIQEKVKQIENFMVRIEEMSTTDLLDITIHREQHYIHEFMDPLIKTYKEKFLLQKTEFVVEEYEEKLVYADLDRVKEVFQNLFENAMKYGDGRWVRVSFYEEDYCQLIKVTSSGGWIESKDFPHLFDSFWRGENAAEKKGSGLGLYICKEIMTKLEGDIFVEREEEGMSFILVFPMY